MTSGVVFISSQVLRKNGGSLTMEQGSKAQGAIISEMKGFFKMMTQLNLEASVNNKI